MIEMLQDLLARRPFTPFRLILSSGDTFEVRHLEFAWLVKGGIYVGIPSSSGGNGKPGLPERAVYCAALHLAGVEQIVGASSTSG